MSNSIGTVFVVTTFGESHGPGIGAVVDGCPAQIPLRVEEIQAQLDRRRPGQSDLTTPRKETDRVEILSGVERGVTLGTPIALWIRNTDPCPADYQSLANIPRPSHADYTWRAKYGVVTASGGGRASARETAARVAAGAVAERLLSERHKVDIVAWVSSVGTIDGPEADAGALTRADVDRHPVRCPDAAAAAAMAAAIRAARDAGDSLGGLITCVCRGVPPGWGEPVFGKLHARLAAAMLSIPAVKGFEIGSGFAGTRLRASEHNDLFCGKGGRLGTVTNRSGGIQGGISNGEDIVLRVAFKPPATIAQPQATADYTGQPAVLAAKGRHDPCVAPRAVPIVEAMAALVLADASLLARAGQP
jgi:chorismate synthase